LHVKRNVSQNEIIFLAAREQATSARGFLDAKTTISGGALVAQLRQLVLEWHARGVFVL
jgi:hypothetical protein